MRRLALLAEPARRPTTTTPWIADAEELHRDDRSPSERPYVGICFGHQLLAQALGGKVERAPTGLGRRRAASTTIVEPLPCMDPPLDAIALIASHQDQVVDVPRDADVIATATNGYCPVAGPRRRRAGVDAPGPSGVRARPGRPPARGPRRAHRRRARRDRARVARRSRWTGRPWRAGSRTSLSTELPALVPNCPMALKVIGAGWGRTGTCSLYDVLERLGFRAAPHARGVPRTRSTASGFSPRRGVTRDWDAHLRRLYRDARLAGRGVLARAR